jgi:hypothetical protein
MTAAVPEVITGQADPGNRAGLSGGAGPDSGACRGASLAERGYVHARFGGVPVLVGPELAAQLKTIRRTQPSPDHGSQQ